jgi:Tfp pilus assembly major pilin PilA
MQNSTSDVKPTENQKKYSEIFFWPLFIALISGIILLYFEHYILNKKVDEANQKIIAANQKIDELNQKLTITNKNIEYFITNSNQLHGDVIRILDECHGSINVQ